MSIQDDKGFVYRLISGFAIGVGMIIPGVSGGVLAILLGFYNRIIQVIAHPFKNLRENIDFAIPLVLGAAVAVLVFSNVLDYLLQHYPIPVIYLFIGLVIGSLPPVVQLANEKGYDHKYLVALAVGFLVVIIPLFFSEITGGEAVTEPSLPQSLFYGFLLALGTIVPGVSSSFLLMIVGAYHYLLHTIATLNIWPLIPIAVGFLVCAIVLSRITAWLFKHYYSWTYYAILGILAGSILVVFPGMPHGLSEILISVGLLLLGIRLSAKLQRTAE